MKFLLVQGWRGEVLLHLDYSLESTENKISIIVEFDLFDLDRY
jgi:hypothetical protein